MKIHDIVGLKTPVSHDIGVEVEIEAYNPWPKMNLPIWVNKPEGSLRNFGIEFVTDGAIPVHALHPQLTELFTTMRDKGMRIVPDNARTSTHMHVNVSNLTLTQYWTMATYYWLVEGVLMPYCGEHRVDNLHCYQLSNAECLLRYMKDEFNSVLYPLTYTVDDRIRYAGQNINCTPRFGSIEYRGMRGTMDVDVLTCWGASLVNMRDKVTQLYENPTEVVDKFYNSKHEEFLGSVFGDMTRIFIGVCGPSWKDYMEDNALLLSEVVYDVKDWNAWEAKIDEAHAIKPKGRKLKLQAEALGGMPNLDEMAAWAARPPLRPEPRLVVANRNAINVNPFHDGELR